MKNLLVLSMNGCPYCEQLKDLLDEGSVSYTEIDIDNFTSEYDMFKKITNSDYLPGFMIIDEETRTLECYAAEQDFFTIEEAFNISKKLIES